jgi:hypothetical protein
MKKLFSINFILILVTFLTINSIYCQKGQILIETTLTKYGPDVKTNFYNLKITPTGAKSFSKAYDINPNDDPVKTFYDLVQYDLTNYPLNYTINSYYKVKPTQTGGPECRESDQGIINSPKSAYFKLCHGESSFVLLDLPDPPKDPMGNCKTISIPKQVHLSGAEYSWQYRKGLNGSWNYFTYNKEYNENGLSFSPNKVSDLINYTGYLYIRFVVTYENLETSDIESYVSNTSIYDIITCSPKLDSTSDPNFTICNYGNGEVTFTFSEPLETGEKFLFNRNPVGSPGIVVSAYSNEVDKVEKISPTTFKWKNIPAGNYEFQYQTLSENNPSTMSPVTGFTITASKKLTFTATDIQPKCSTDKGSILITATGGTSTYFYILDNEPLANKHPFTSPYTIQNLSDGNHSVIVVDSENCIEK